jgi:hypothetical protein
MVHTMLMILKVMKGLLKVFVADSKEGERERERKRERAYYKISIAFPKIPTLQLPSIS